MFQTDVVAPDDEDVGLAGLCHCVLLSRSCSSGALDRGADVRHYSNAYTFFHSRFMSTTIQPFVLASRRLVECPEARRAVVGPLALRVGVVDEQRRNAGQVRRSPTAASRDHRRSPLPWLPITCSGGMPPANERLDDPPASTAFTELDDRCLRRRVDPGFQRLHDRRWASACSAAAVGARPGLATFEVHGLARLPAEEPTATGQRRRRMISTDTLPENEPIRAMRLTDSVPCGRNRPPRVWGWGGRQSASGAPGGLLHGTTRRNRFALAASG